MIYWQKFKLFIKGIVFPPGANPISPMLLVSVFLCSFGNSMILTMPFSFLPRMMKDFGVTEKDVGYYVGITASSLFIGRTFASYFWGWLCDRIGYRKTILISIALVLFATVAFGLSKSVTWAITTRLLQGLVGGLIISLKAAVYSLCDETNSSIGFSFVLGAYAVGMVLGPSLGGFTVYPAEKFPKVFPKGSFFDKFPTFLPHLVVVLLIAISFVLAYFYIPEKKRATVNEKTNLLENSVQNGDINQEKVDQEENHLRITTLTTSFDYESFLLISTKRSSQCVHDVCLDETEDRKTTSYFVTVKENGRKSNCFSSLWKSILESSLVLLLRRRSVLLTLSMYGLVSFTNTGFDELFPIFADSSSNFGGLSFSTDEIGMAILIAAIPITILTFLFAQIERRVGAKRISFIVSNILVFVMPLFSYIGLLDKSLIWYALIPLLILMRILISISFFVVNIFLNNSVESKYLGAINGLGMTIACLFRTVSPIVLGGLYSWSMKNEGQVGYPFNHFLPFVLNGFVALILVFLTALLPKDYIRNLNTEDKDNSNNTSDDASDNSNDASDLSEDDKKEETV